MSSANTVVQFESVKHWPLVDSCVTCSFWLHFQRGEIICQLAELLTERKEEILAANKMDMDLAINAGVYLKNVNWVFIFFLFAVLQSL